MSEDGLPPAIEFFVASDTAAIVEHTKRVLYLEDDDIAHIPESELHIHRLHHDEDGRQTPSTRSLETLEIGIAEIMNGKFSHFMQKEIYEQPQIGTRCLVVSTLTTTRSPLVVSVHTFLTSDVALCSQHVAPATILVSLSVPSSKNSPKSLSALTSYHSCIAIRAIFENV